MLCIIFANFGKQSLFVTISFARFENITIALVFQNRICHYLFDFTMWKTHYPWTLYYDLDNKILNL